MLLTRPSLVNALSKAEAARSLKFYSAKAKIDKGTFLNLISLIPIDSRIMAHTELSFQKNKLTVPDAIYIATGVKIGILNERIISSHVRREATFKEF